MINAVDKNKNSNNITTKTTLVAGTAGYIASQGINIETNQLMKIYKNKVLNNQPVMFNDEEKYFQELINNVKVLNEKYPQVTRFSDMLESLKNTEPSTKNFIEKAYSIYNSKEVIDSKKYSSDFIKLGIMANKETPDEKLICFANQLLTVTKISKEEKEILTAFINNPTQKKNLFNLSKICEICANRNLLSSSLNVLVNPELLSLAKKMLTDNNLDKRGVGYSFSTPDGANVSREKIIEELKTSKNNMLEKLNNKKPENIFSKIYIKIKKGKTKSKFEKAIKSKNSSFNMIVNGTNAFYLSGLKKVFVPVLTEKREAIFHELGHAINYNISSNLSKWISFLKHKFPNYALPVITISSLFLKKTDSSDAQKDSVIHKIRKAVKNNIMVVSLLISSPKLIEEGIASVRAMKFLRGKVSTKQLQNAGIKHLTSWGSYGLNALFIAIGLKFGVWVSDKIQTAK